MARTVIRPKFRMNQPVALKWHDKIVLGTVENFAPAGRTIVYEVRGEDGRLYPPLPADSGTEPGYIMSQLTRKYFDSKKSASDESEQEST